MPEHSRNTLFTCGFFAIGGREGGLGVVKSYLDAVGLYFGLTSSFLGCSRGLVFRRSISTSVS